MGNSNAKVNRLDNEIAALKEQMNLLKDLDKNNDGIISKNEFLNWKEEQTAKMEKLEKAIEEQINGKYNLILMEKDSQLRDANLKIDELTKQIEFLKVVNAAQTIKPVKSMDNMNKNETQPLSREITDEFIEKLLSDDRINIGYLPDFVERQIYKNVFNLLFAATDDILSSMSIKFLGHELILNTKPND